MSHFDSAQCGEFQACKAVLDLRIGKAMAKIIDISQRLSAGMAVWPGDSEFKAFWTAQRVETGSVNIGGVSMSLHTGTHIDTPKHFRDDGESPAQLDLEPFVGEAVVVDLAQADPHLLTVGITPQLIKSLLSEESNFAPRVLFRTATGGATGMFPDSFGFLTAEAAKALVEMKVKLVGIDTPSVDRVDSKEMEVHHILADHGIGILEGLALSHVEPGRYELIALPLKFEDMDASPVRAILRTIE